MGKATVGGRRFDGRAISGTGGCPSDRAKYKQTHRAVQSLTVLLVLDLVNILLLPIMCFILENIIAQHYGMENMFSGLNKNDLTCLHL